MILPRRSPSISALIAPARAQMIHQFLFQHPARLDEETSIDRLVRHSQPLVVRKLDLQPTGDLFRRPIQRQFTGDDVAQRPVAREYTLLGAQRRPPGSIICSSGAISIAPAVSCNSRLTVEGARPRRAAIDRKDAPVAMPLEMSSRSAKVNAQPARLRTAGAIPPR